MLHVLRRSELPNSQYKKEIVNTLRITVEKVRIHFLVEESIMAIPPH